MKNRTSGLLLVLTVTAALSVAVVEENRSAIAGRRTIPGVGPLGGRPMPRSVPAVGTASGGASRFRPVVPGIVTVKPARTEDLETIEKLVSENGGEVLGRCGLRSSPSVRVRVKAAALGKLMELSEVTWLANPVPKYKHNDVAAGVMGVTNVWPSAGATADTLGLTGRGQYITTSDTGIDTGDMATVHRDFTNALVGFSTLQYNDGWKTRTTQGRDLDGHGTHTAGSIVGDGTMSGGTIRGTAYGAKLWAWFCGGHDGGIYTPAYVDDLFRPQPLVEGIACIHSASWGGDSFCYTAESRDIDEYCWRHPDFLPVFSAGNAGSSSGTVGPEGCAKNVLTVGASESDRGGYRNGWSCQYPNRITSFSSRGPTPDGRVKPDVVAPGTGICSARSSQSEESMESRDQYYWYMQGTSMSCPLVAGSAALVREWLVDRRGIAAPSAALVKAVLTGGADELSGRLQTNVTGPAPNGKEGWGRVNVGASVAPDAGRSVYLADYLPFHAGSNVVFTVVTTNAAPFEAQLVWIDYPGRLSKDIAAPVLVNDLNLSVREPGGAIRFGNGGAEPDHLNNVESVRVASAAAGVYEVSVAAVNIPHPSDEGGAAALYLRGAFDPNGVSAVTAGVETVSLTISASCPGDRLAEPAIGEYSFIPGNEVTLRADAYSVVTGQHGNASTRYPFIGFTGSGSVPASGVTNVLRFTILEDSAIDWKWDSEHPEYRYRAFLRLYGFADNVRKFWKQTSVEYDRYLDRPYPLSDSWIATNEQFSVRLPDDLAYDPLVRTGYHSTNDWHTYVQGEWRYRFAQAFYGRTDEDLMYLYDGDTGRNCQEVTITMDEGCDLVLDYYEEKDVLPDLCKQTWAPTWWTLRNLWWLDYQGSPDAGADADPDGDGFSNLDEYRIDTDPLDPDSCLRMTGVSTTNVSWIGGREVPQVLECRRTLGSGFWSPVCTNLSGNAAFSFNTQGDESNMFYRVVVPSEFQR